MQNTLALLHFNDSNNIIRDEISGNVYTINGATHTTSNVKFGTGGLAVSGGQYIKSDTAYDWSATDFTLEAFITFTSWSGWYLCLQMSQDDRSNTATYGVCSGKLAFNFNGNDDHPIGPNLSLNTPYHFAMVYDSSAKQIKYFLDGELKATHNYDLGTVQRKMFIGASWWTSGSAVFDEVRLSNIQRYTENFTVPTKAFFYGTEVDDLVYFPFHEKEIKDYANNEWNVYGTPKVTSDNARWNYALNLDANSYLISKAPIKLGTKFTIEAYFTPTSFPNEWPMIFSAASALNSENNRIFLSARASDGGVGYDNSGAACAHFACTFTANTQYHMAYCYDNGILRVFINGVCKYNGSVDIVDVERYIIIGRNSNPTAWNFIGAIDWFRITTNYCRWYDDFEVPQYPKSRTTMDMTQINTHITLKYGTDPDNLNQTFLTNDHVITTTNYATHLADIDAINELQEDQLKEFLNKGVGVLMHFDANATTDAMGNPWVVDSSYTPGVATTNAKFNSAVQFDATYKQTTKSDWLYLGYYDFTIDFWVYMDSACTTYGHVFEFNKSGQAADPIRFEMARDNGGSALKFYAYDKNGNQTNYLGTGAIVGTLAHIALTFTKSSNKWNLYVNGVNKGNITFAITPGSYKLRIGNGIMDYGTYFAGAIEEFKLTQGIVLWTANFTPPTYPGNINFNIPLPAPMTGNYKATNGTTYYYKVDFSNVDDTNTKFVISWGTSTSYGQTYYTSPNTAFTESNYLTTPTTLTNNANTQINNLKTYLNTLIGTITAPAATTSSYSSGGVTYSYKITYSGGNTNITATSCTLTATLTWSRNATTYGNTYNARSITITTSNMANATSLIQAEGTTLKTKFETAMAFGVKALLHFDTNATTDAVSGNVWSANKTTSVGTANAKFGSAVQFNTTNAGYISLADPIMIGGDDDFTIDFWTYISSNSASYGFAMSAYPDTTSNAAGRIFFSRRGTENALCLGIDTIGDPKVPGTVCNTLYHIAIVYSGSAKATKVYVNGILQYTKASYTVPVNKRFLALGGAVSNSGAHRWPMIGTVDEFRLVRGSQLWTQNFTPPTIAGTTNAAIVQLPATMTGSFTVGESTIYWQGTFSNDSEYVARYTLKYGTTSGSYTTQFSSLTSTFTAFNVSTSYTTLTNNMNTQVSALRSSLDTGVKVLMHFNDSTTADEIATNTWVVTKGTVSVGAANAKFGNALQCNQSAINTTNQIYIGGADFTIDCWAYVNSTLNYPGIFALTPSLNLNQGHAAGRIILERQGANDRMDVDLIDMDGGWRLDNDNTIVCTGGVNNVLNHYAMVYDWTNKTFKFYKNGVCTYTKTNTTISGGLRYVFVGCHAYNETNYPPLIGTVDEFRVITGVALWKANFTPPTMAGNTTFNVPLPAAITGTHAATNGITYYYQAQFFNTGDTTANFKVVWGTSTSYGQTYYTAGNSTFTKDNYLDAPSTLTTAANTQITNLKNYLNTLVGNVTAPAEETGTIVTDATYYWKCTHSVSGLGITATTATVTSTLVFGTSTSYGTTWGSYNLSVTVSNRTNFSTDSNKTTLLNELTDYLTPGVKVLLHFDGDSALTDAVSGNTWTQVGTVSTATTNAKFTKAGQFNGSSYLKMLKTIALGGRSFTIDMWQYMLSANMVTRRTLIEFAVNASSSYSFYMGGTKSYYDFYTWNYSNAIDFYPSSSAVCDKLVHIAWVYNHSAKTLKLFINGTTVYTYSGNISVLNTLQKFNTIYVGAGVHHTLGQTNMNGQLDEVRVINGIAMWSDAFTPPTRAGNVSFNVPLPNTISGSHVATNGITYYYKATFTNSSDTAATILLVWGTSTSYGQTYYNQATTFIASNYLNAISTLTSTANTQINNLKNYFNTLIGNVTAPTDSDHTKVATNGLTYHYKTNFTGSNTSITATSCAVTVATVWGMSNSYGQTYKTETVTVTASNYKTYSTTLTDTGSEQRTDAEEYFNTLIGTVTVPAAQTGTFATGGGTIYYRGIATGGTTSLTATSCTITISGQYGVVNTYGYTYLSESHTITPSNYKTYSTDLTNKITNHFNSVKAGVSPGIKILSHFNNNSTTDATGNAWNAYPSGWALDESNKKFGAAAYKSNSGGTVVRQAKKFPVCLDFTIDYWGYFTVADNKEIYLTHAKTGMVMGYNVRKNAILLHKCNVGFTFNIQNKDYFTLNEWHHFAITRKDYVTRFFVDGILKETATGNNNWVFEDTTKEITVNAGLSIDELRVITGVAMWSANFTPPTIEGNASYNIPLPPSVSGTHTAKNGNTYYYKSVFSNVNDTTAKIEIVWGLDTSYGQTYHTSSPTFTSSNYLDAATTMTNTANTQINNLKNFLDTLIGTVTAPAADTGTVKSSNGSTTYAQFNYRTSYSGGNTAIAATSCTLTATTGYSYGTSYGNTFKKDTITVTIKNLSTYTSEIKAYSATHKAALEKYLTAGVTSLLSFDSTVAKDEITTNQWTVAGTNELSTAHSKFNKGVHFTKSSGYMVMNNLIGLGGQDFTIDVWAYGDNGGGYSSERIFDIDLTKLTNTSYNRITLLYRGCFCPVGRVLESERYTSDGKLHHHAITFDYKTYVWKYYLDGKCILTTNGCEGLYFDRYVSLGYNTYYSVPNAGFDSYFDDFRITNGRVVWTENFTPPTIAATTDFYVALPAQITGTHKATNGTTYYYKVDFSNKDATTGQYVVSWGTSTSYGQIYFTGTEEFTNDNFLTSVSVLKTKANTQITNLKNYLNTLIGTVTAPTDTDHTVTATNGIVYHYKTNYTGGNTSITATTCTLTATTVWGTSTSYGQTYKADNLTVTITNLSEATSSITSTGGTQQTNLKAYLNTLIGTVTPPATESNSFIIDGTTYYYQLVHTGSNTSITATSCTVTSQCKWGRSTSYDQVYSNETLTITPSNYKTYATTLTNNVKANLEKLKAELAPGVKAMLHFEDSLIKDDTGRTWVIRGTPVHTGDKAKFGSKSGTFANSSSMICTRAPIFEDKDFTVDFWEYSPLANMGTGKVAWQYFATSGITGKHTHGIEYCYWTDYIEPHYYLGQGKGGGWVIWAGANFTRINDQWVHRAVVRKGNYIYAFENGKLKGTNEFAKYIYDDYNTYMFIGNFIRGNRPTKGYVDEFRFVKGLALWTTDFTPGTVANNLTAMVLLPATKTGTYQATNGITYYYKTTFSNDSNLIGRYTTIWGTSTSYGQTYSNKTTKFDESTYSNSQVLLSGSADSEINALKNYLNTLIGTVTTPATIEKEYKAKNGTTYKYKSTYTGSSNSITATSCAVSCTTVWGTSTSYGQTYKTDSATITATNYQTRDTVLGNVATTHETNLKKYLDTLVGTVTAPAKVEDTYTPTTNKIKYYYQTSYSGGNTNITATTCTLTVTTVWGTGTTYGQTFKTENLTVTISNLSTAISSIQSKGTQEIADLKTYLNDRIGNVTVPAQSSGTFMIDSTKYTYSITHTGGNTDITATECNVVTQCSWYPTDKGTDYTQIYAKDTTRIVANTYPNYSTTLTQRGTLDIDNLKKALTPGIKALLHFDGSINKDECDNVWTIVGTPTLNSEFYKFGGKATSYQNDKSMIKTRAVILEDRDFTIDFWEYLPASVGNDIINMQLIAIDYDDGRDAHCLSTLYYQYTTNPVCWLSNDANSGWNYDIANTKLGDRIFDRWVHRALVRESNKIKTYQDGILCKTIDYTTYLKDSFDRFVFIGNYALDSNRKHRGYIDEVRITTGMALWKENFIPPTMAGDKSIFVSLPTDISGTYVAKNGVTYYYKTSFSMDSNSVGRYVTVWGKTNSYGQSYSNKTTTFTAANCINSQTTLKTNANTEINALKNYLDTLIDIVTPDATTTHTYKATNGITYNYKKTYTGGNTSITATSCNLGVTVSWSTDTSYSNTFNTDSVTVTVDNLTTSKSSLTTKTNTIESNLKTYLNTLIGPITLPAANTEVYTSKSGKKFYLRTQYSKKSTTDTQCVITYTTDWGFTNSYGTSYSSKEHTVISSNYQTRNTDLTNKSKAEFTSCHSLFALWDLALPTNTSEDWTSLGDEPYKIKVTFTQGATSDTTNTINYTVSYIKKTNPEVAFYSGSETFTSSNYNNYTAILNNAVASTIEDLKYYINHPNIDLPENVDEVIKFDVYWEFHVQIQFTKGTTVNIGVVKCFIDTVQFGETITKEYYTMESAAEDLPKIKQEIYDEVNRIIKTAPVVKNTDYTVGGMTFRCRNIYGKSADRLSTTIYVKVDEDATNRKLKDHTMNITDLEADLAKCKEEGEAILAQCLATVKTAPDSFNTIVTYGGFNFRIDVSFDKNINKRDYNIILKLDGDSYSTTKFTYSTTDMSTFLTNANNLVNALKSVLSNVPQNTYEIFTIRRYNWGISLMYEKAAMSHDVKKWLILDGYQYGSTQTDKFDVTNISDISTYLANLKTSLKNLLTSNGAPEDIVRYRTIRNVEFGILVTFSKEAEESIIYISYFAINRFISPKINELPYNTSIKITDIVGVYVTEEIINETIEMLIEFTYEAAEPAGVLVWGINHIPDTADEPETHHPGYHYDKVIEPEPPLIDEPPIVEPEVVPI